MPRPPGLGRIRPLFVALLAALPNLALAAGPAPRPIGPAGRAEYRIVRVANAGPVDFAELLNAGFDVERNGRREVIAYVTAEEMDKLEALGFAWTELPDPGLAEFLARTGQADGPLAPDAAYHDYASWTAQLQQVASDHPAIARRISAGKSVQGRDLWWMKISDNPDAEEDEPAFKFVANIHGDEKVGTENVLRLIDWLTDRYATDSRVRRLVDNLEIWLMPSMNPDGNALAQRYNAAGIDMNRDFPDLWNDPVNTIDGRARETGLMMTWQFAHQTMLSANFHGGEVVTNYPYDGNTDGMPIYSTAPDDDVLLDISLDYAEDNGPMSASSSFPQGVTNGADWYTLYGGMQDWNYVWQGDVDLTIELSATKTPAASTLDAYWNDNRESMLSYMERALTGVRGRVTDALTGAPLLATLRVAGRTHPFYTDLPVGDFQRVLKAGSYLLEVSAEGYQARTIPFSVTSTRGDATRLDVTLWPLPTGFSATGSRVAQDTDGDGWLEPGEAGQLAVTLRNGGAAASGIAGTLRPLTPWGRAQTGAAWPDLGPGAAAESLPPHLGLSVAPGAPAGHKLAFAVDWTAAGGARGTTDAFFVPLGAPTLTTRDATDTPKSIPNPGTTTSAVTVASDEELLETDVRVTINHPYLADLRVTLVAPDGTRVRLHARQGGSGDNINTTYDTLTAPADSLDVLRGRSSAGTWTLEVKDDAAGNAGSLQSWRLELKTRPWEIPLPEVLLCDLTRQAGGATALSWWPVGSALSYRVYRGSDPQASGSFVDVTSEDVSASDTAFTDRSASAPGSLTCWLVSAVGVKGEGLLGHYGR
jgi:carboxypeptidase D